MKSNVGAIVGLVMAGALFIGCGSELEAKPEPESKSKGEQEEGIAAIKEIAGSEVILTPDFSVDLKDIQITDAGLEHLKGLAGLQELDVSGTEITDAASPRCRGVNW